MDSVAAQARPRGWITRDHHDDPRQSGSATQFRSACDLVVDPGEWTLMRLAEDQRAPSAAIIAC
jgi:hypothetical protein